MRPRKQKQPQVKKEPCRVLDDVDVDLWHQDSVLKRFCKLPEKIGLLRSKEML